MSPSAANGGSFYFNSVSPPVLSREMTIDSARRYLGHTEEEMEESFFGGGQEEDEKYDNESSRNSNSNADDDNITTNPAFRSPSSKTTISTVVSKRMTDAEKIIRLTEQSVGLLSLQDYKSELARIIAAKTDMEIKFQSELDLAGQELHSKDEQLDQYRIIMEEAERAIASYEEAVHKLEEASNEKDALIEQLSERVTELELELERVLGEKTTTDAEHITTIETLKANIGRLKSDAEVRDVDQSELHDNITNLESKLDTVTKSYTSLQAELTNAHGIIALRDERIHSSEQEVILMKDMLQGHVQLYQNEISLSLENAKLVMDSLTNQKDSIIATLNDKIDLLEQSLTELEEEKEVYAMTNEKSNKELNEKIHTLAIALTEKDRLIELLQQQQQQQQHSSTHQEKAVSTPTSRPDPETSEIKLARHNRQAYDAYSNNERGGYGEMEDIITLPS
jgi:chromosome segregation ATPase